MKKQKPKYKNIEFASHEEVEFYKWCEEAKSAGLILDFIYQPDTYTLSEQAKYTKPVQLKTKVRYDSRELLKPHVYTPDFELFVSQWAEIGIFEKHHLFCNRGRCFVDVKGKAPNYDDGRSFVINQKWMYQKHGIYVNKVIPEKFFKKTWCPEKARFTPKTGKLRKKYNVYPLIADYLNAL